MKLTINRPPCTSHCTFNSSALPGGRKAESCWREPEKVCLSPRPITPSSLSPFPVRFSTLWEAPTSVSWWTCTVSMKCKYLQSGTPQCDSSWLDLYALIWRSMLHVFLFYRIIWPHMVFSLWYLLFGFHLFELQVSSRPVHAEWDILQVCWIKKNVSCMKCFVF